MVEIYTDASVGKDKAVTTCIVLTNMNYIGYSVFTHPDVTTSVHGEILGANNALKYASERLQLDDESVTLFVDSIALLNLLKCNLDDPGNKQVQLYEKELQELQSMLDKYHVDVRLIRGHKIDHNPNKVVDLMSNSLLRFKSKEV